jgi:hypothetical protein
MGILVVQSMIYRDLDIFSFVVVDKRADFSRYPQNGLLWISFLVQVIPMWGNGFRHWPPSFASSLPGFP